MSRQHSTRLSSLLFFLGVMFTVNSPAQQTPEFAGNWVLRLGNRIFIVVTLSPILGSGGHFTGSLARPQHFSIATGAFFSGINGPAVHYPIIRSASKGNCVSFTTQNPADNRDKDDFQLCTSRQGHGSLKIDIAGFEPWPVAREKGPLSIAGDWDSARNYFVDDTDISNPEMQRIFEADQKDRQPGVGKIDWGVVERADAFRREQTRQLLSTGKLHTGEDFERAAFVFQHGDAPDDYLLAHTLAMVAVARGRGGALWIEAATLDRYLNSVHQPQIYGTQFYFKPKEPTTQEPYNRAMIPDALRRNLGVPSLAAQEEQRKKYDSEDSQH
ncbi:MAG: hypothetical protein ABSF46_10245 [Terriglobia bacterium]